VEYGRETTRGLWIPTRASPTMQAMRTVENHPTMWTGKLENS
jgi:hypothetical protein